MDPSCETITLHVEGLRVTGLHYTCITQRGWESATRTGVIQLLRSMFAQYSPIKLCLYTYRYTLLDVQLPVTTQSETQTIWRLATESE
jgi:hypothetical protein